MLRVSKRPIPANHQHFRQLSSNVQVDFTALVTANQQLAPNGCSRVDDLFFRAAVGITFLLSFWGFVLCNVCSFEGWNHLKTLHCCLWNCTARFWQMTLHGYNFITTDAQNIKKKNLESISHNFPSRWFYSLRCPCITNLKQMLWSTLVHRVATVCKTVTAVSSFSSTLCSFLNECSFSNFIFIKIHKKSGLNFFFYVSLHCAVFEPCCWRNKNVRT